MVQKMRVKGKPVKCFVAKFILYSQIKDFSIEARYILLQKNIPGAQIKVELHFLIGNYTRAFLSFFTDKCTRPSFVAG